MAAALENNLCVVCEGTGALLDFYFEGISIHRPPPVPIGVRGSLNRGRPMKTGPMVTADGRQAAVGFQQGPHGACGNAVGSSRGL